MFFFSTYDSNAVIIASFHRIRMSNISKKNSVFLCTAPSDYVCVCLVVCVVFFFISYSLSPSLYLPLHSSALSPLCVCIFLSLSEFPLLSPSIFLSLFLSRFPFLLLPLPHHSYFLPSIFLPLLLVLPLSLSITASFARSRNPYFFLSFSFYLVLPLCLVLSSFLTLFSSK